MCSACTATMSESSLPSRCSMCHTLTKDSATCKTCARTYSLPKNVWVHSQYEAEAKTLVRLLKYDRTREAARVMAKLLHEMLPYFEPSHTVFVPIPTAPKRIRARGFDHTLAIVKELSRLRGVEYATLLTRTTNTQQVGSSRKQRLSQLDGAFTYKTHELSKHTRIVLIDDLMTTGGSLIAATVALKKVGHKHVYAAVFAQK